MRRSTAKLARSDMLLWDLKFPHERIHIHRTRLPFIHLERVLHYAKMDRDGRVDGFLAVYLPDELTVLFLKRGELANAVSYREDQRIVLPIGRALKHIDEETERGEIEFASASAEQLSWMFHSCSQPAAPRFVETDEPESVLTALQNEVYSGVLELIANGSVNYLCFENGDLVRGCYRGKKDDQPAAEWVQHMLAPDGTGNRPRVTASVFDHVDAIPEQASPKLIETYRVLFWAIVDRADGELSGGGRKQALKYRDLLLKLHPSLEAVGRPTDEDLMDLVATPSELAMALCEWTAQFLEQVEIVAPGAAPDILKAATKDQRFVLQKAGYYEKLPWTVRW